MKSAGEEVKDQKGRAAGPEGEAKGHLIFLLGYQDIKLARHSCGKFLVHVQHSLPTLLIQRFVQTWCNVF